MIDLKELLPLDLHPAIAWIGRVPGWCRFYPGTPLITAELGAVSRTITDIDFDALRRAPGANRHEMLIRALYRAYDKGDSSLIATVESWGRVLADGPKLFLPTDDQWEAMEQVEIRLPIRDFRAPYPTLIVQIPETARKRLAKLHGVEPHRTPRAVMIRHRHEPGENAVVNAWCKFDNREQCCLFQDQPLNALLTIEDLIRRRVIKNDRDLDPQAGVDYGFSIDAYRTAMNLCLMLTHYGCRVRGPVDPVAYAKHRRKKNLEHFKHGDFLAVEMTQNVRIRDTIIRPAADLGGTGIELTPHWRRGHWRAAPGRGAARRAGETVPLVFVRPCLVRPDRMVGDVSETSVTYMG